MSFSETLLDLGYDYGTVSSYRYSTTIVVEGDSREKRNINWTQPLAQWQLGGRVFNREEVDYIIGFHAARKGAYQGFLYKDWADYQFNNSIGTGDGIKTEFQLYKTYAVAAYGVKRPIFKPISVTVTVNGIIEEDVTLDTTTGVVTFDSPPSNGAAIIARGEFYCPVRFEQDSLRFRFIAADPYTGEAFFAFEELSLVEIRLGNDLPLDTVPNHLDHTFNLGYDYETTGGPSFLTGVDRNRGGFEERVALAPVAKRSFQVGDRTLTTEELSYFISLFRVARGAGISFNFYDWQQEETIKARFEDSISFRFDAASSEEKLFYLSGVVVVEAIQESLALSEVAGFDQTFPYNSPPGYYPFTVNAPASFDDYEDHEVRAILTFAEWDNGAMLGTFLRPNTLGTFSGEYFLGYGKSFPAWAYQYPAGSDNGPLYFRGTIRWEAWTIS